jgi:hypothetical protein
MNETWIGEIVFFGSFQFFHTFFHTTYLFVFVDCRFGLHKSSTYLCSPSLQCGNQSPQCRNIFGSLLIGEMTSLWTTLFLSPSGQTQDFLQCFDVFHWCMLCIFWFPFTIHEGIKISVTGTQHLMCNLSGFVTLTNHVHQVLIKVFSVFRSLYTSSLHGTERMGLMYWLARVFLPDLVEVFP